MNNLQTTGRAASERKVKVFTAAEIKEKVRNGNVLTVDDVDAVTCGTFGVMSGTMIMLSMSVAEPGIFRKADSVTLNGVKGHPGPCPNESLGVVDCIIYGTEHRDMFYGGGHLFKDIVSGHPIDVKIRSDKKTVEKRLTIDDIPFARMIITRGAFKNYTGFVNPEKETHRTIFSVMGMHGLYEDMSVSGCGEINPLENDPDAVHLKEGTSVLINGVKGMIIGDGTRSSPDRKNLSAFADMKGMDPDMMGGFITSLGPECLTSVAAAIPITDEISLKNVCILDEDIKIPISDVHTRTPIGEGTYGEVWTGTDREVTIIPENCKGCNICDAVNLCPVGATGIADIDRRSCVMCGTCVKACKHKVFNANLGSVMLNGTDVNITLRQSDRNRAEALCVLLKRMIERGDWKVGGM
jgi:putative methanogenesis marker 16 metalloprotein